MDGERQFVFHHPVCGRLSVCPLFVRLFGAAGALLSYFLFLYILTIHVTSWLSTPTAASLCILYVGLFTVTFSKCLSLLRTGFFLENGYALLGRAKLKEIWLFFVIP